MVKTTNTIDWESASEYDVFSDPNPKHRERPNSPPKSWRPVNSYHRKTASVLWNSISQVEKHMGNEKTLQDQTRS